MKQLSLIFAVVFLVGCAGMVQKEAMANAHAAFAKNDCKAVYEYLTKAEHSKKPAAQLQGEISYMRGECFEKEKKFEDAIGSYLYIVKNFPELEYAYRARAKLTILSKQPIKENKPLPKDNKSGFTF